MFKVKFLPHMDFLSSAFERNFVHGKFHQKNATAMNASDVSRGCRVRDLINVKSLSFVPHRDRDFIKLTAAANMDVFLRVLMISMKDGVCQGLAQCDLTVGLAFRETAALPHQKHELVHEGRNCGHFARQRALYIEVSAAVIMVYSHSETILNERSSPQSGDCILPGIV